MSNIDFTKIEFEFEDDWDIFEELFLEYSNKSLEMISTLKSSCDNKDFSRARRQAHTLKGVVSNFYFEDIRILCQKIESDLEKNSLDGIQKSLVSLGELNTFLLTEISSYIKNKKAVS